jgi:hypothetical protein
MSGMAKEIQSNEKYKPFVCWALPIFADWIEATAHRQPMQNAPALLVRHRRSTLVIGILLACAMAIAAIGVSIELHQAEAAISLVLAPLVFVAIAAGMLRLAYERWSTSTVCLAASAEGLSLPGTSARLIPWSAVRSVRNICCSLTAEYAAEPRQYLLFEIEAAPARGIGRSYAPLVVLDVSEVDTSKDVILDAMRYFRSVAVANTNLGREIRPAHGAAAARIGLSPLELAWLGARRLSVGAAPLAASVLSDARTLIAAAAALQRTIIAHLQHARALRYIAMTRFARGHRFVRDRRPPQIGPKPLK